MSVYCKVAFKWKHHPTVELEAQRGKMCIDYVTKIVCSFLSRSILASSWDCIF